MKRRGAAIGLEETSAAVGGDEVELGLRLESVMDPDRMEEVREVCAAPHADVLAGINQLAGYRIGKRPGTAAEPLARFQEGHTKTTYRQCRCRRQARQSTANNRDTFHSHSCLTIEY
jgi:hypothetical protein